MTKYFDLLRAHQEKKEEPLSGASAEPLVTTSENTATNNPYSKSNNQNTTDDVALDASVELINEHDSEPSSQQSPADLEALLVEDEHESISPQATTTPQVISNTPPSLEHVNTQDFNVAHWLESMSKNIQDTFQKAEQNIPTDLSIFDAALMSFLQHVEEDHKILDAFELEISRNIKHICDAECSVNDLVEKSIMMMLYTIKISLQLKLQPQETWQHTVAAMLHHIGMSMVPYDTRHKVGKLSKAEIKTIRQAPDNAVAYLKSCDNHTDKMILAASQAAERYDGSGPTGLKGHSISWTARVVGLLSMFEALIHFRPYRQRLLPRDAIRELVNHHKKAFDPVMLKALIEAVSLYPVGTFVQLNTGEVGQVILVHNKFPLRPVVYITMDKHGNAITEREINLKEQPNLMIQKCMYEESIGNAENAVG